MIDETRTDNQIELVTDFQELIDKPFQNTTNALCWKRNLVGNFNEIVQQIDVDGDMVELNEDELKALKLSENGDQARETILSDIKYLREAGASPVLNIIKYYERDDSYPPFPTDVYSYHVDRSPIPTATFLCTYSGESSEILPNSQAEQKITIPEIRNELLKLFGSKDNGFEEFLTDNFFDLHYQPKSNATPIRLGKGNIWKLAVDHPESQVLPCLHRAPKEKPGEHRLLLIC